MSTDLIEQMKKRRSIRAYKDKPVDKKLIEEIIQAGRYAPSATNRQPWRFIVITQKQLINDIAVAVKDEMKKILKKRFILKYFYPSLKNDNTIKFLAATIFSEKDMLFFNAPVLIFVVTKKGKFLDESCACCAQNMMLAAHWLGLGSCWIGFAHFLGLNKTWMKKINVPDGYHISAALIFGHPETIPARAPLRKPEADIISWMD
jgi:nitroreductase